MAVRLLVVDDHAAFRAWATELFECSAFGVVGAAHDGASAIEAVRSLRPEVVLLDIQLSDIHGFEVARRLATEPDPPAVVLTSARDRSDYGSKLSNAAARGFISKLDLSVASLSALLCVRP